MGFHRSQIFFYLLASFLAGVFIASFGLLDSKSVIFLSLVGVACIALGLKNKKGLLAGFLILASAGGAARFLLFNRDNHQISEFSGHKIELNGYVDSEPSRESNKVRFTFKTNQAERILITTNFYPERSFGDILKVEGVLELPQNFGDFDYVTYLKKDGIRMIMSYPKISAGNLSLSEADMFRLQVYKNIFILKNKFSNAINMAVPEPNAGFINGILLGTRQNISQDLKDSFSKTGTTHILAISGYNIMIISEAVLLGLMWFVRRRVAFWISVIVVVLFVILTGASASVVRAAIMGLILSFAHGYGRLYDQKNSIILAGATMIWLNPLVLIFDIGFQLSFAAVLGLIYLYPLLDRKLFKLPNLGGLKELALMTISAQTAVAPLLIYYFGNFSIISLPTNLLILPLVPASMFLGFVTGLSGLVFPVIGKIFGYLAWAITAFQLNVINYIAGL